MKSLKNNTAVTEHKHQQNGQNVHAVQHALRWRATAVGLVRVLRVKQQQQQPKRENRLVRLVNVTITMRSSAPELKLPPPAPRVPV